MSTQATQQPVNESAEPAEFAEPPRRRAPLTVFLLVLLVVAVPAVGAGIWWTESRGGGSARVSGGEILGVGREGGGSARKGGGGGARPDGAPDLSGRPRLTDSRAGLSYAVPAGWKQDAGGDLVQAFTSSVTAKPSAGTAEDAKEGTLVLAGRGAPVPETRLKEQTEEYAGSNAEYFFPYSKGKLIQSRALKVNGRPAHTVLGSITPEEGSGPKARMRMTVVAVDAKHSVFLLGLSQPAGRDWPTIEAVMASLRLDGGGEGSA